MKNQLLFKIIIDLVTVIATIDCQLTDYYTFEEDPELIKITVDEEGTIYIHELINEDELENEEFNAQKILDYIDSGMNIPKDLKEDIRDRINHGEENIENKKDINPHNSSMTDEDEKDVLVTENKEKEKKIRTNIELPNEDLFEDMDIEKEHEKNVAKETEENVETTTIPPQNYRKSKCNYPLEGVDDSGTEENFPLSSETDNINEDIENTTPSSTGSEYRNHKKEDTENTTPSSTEFEDVIQEKEDTENTTPSSTEFEDDIQEKENTENTFPTSTEFEYGIQKQNISLNKKEFDGKFAEPGQFKYHVQIRTIKKSVKICSGAIINERMIITSAKCLSGQEEKSLKIVAGTPNTVVLSVSKIIFFNKKNVDLDDIALLKTKQNISLENSTNLEKLKYNFLKVPTGSNVTITGSKCFCSLSKLKYDVTQTVCKQKCKDMYPFTNEESFCGVVPNNGTGIKCFEELGSPVVLDGYIVGIVSVSTKGQPSRYISINYYIDWLLTQIVRHSYIP